MHDDHTAFLLNEKGQRLPLDSKDRALTAPSGSTSDFVDEAVNQRGYVFFALARRVAVIEVSPDSVQPRAARRASRILINSAVECVLLFRAGDTGRCSKYEFFASKRVARATLLWLARSAERRVAFERRVRAMAALDAIDDEPWLPAAAYADQQCDAAGFGDAGRREHSGDSRGAIPAGCRQRSPRRHGHPERAGRCGHRYDRR